MALPPDIMPEDRMDHTGDSRQSVVLEMDHSLSPEQTSELMHAFVDIEADDPDEDEAFRRMAELFNRIYRMGQQHERGRWVVRSSQPPILERT